MEERQFGMAVISSPIEAAEMIAARIVESRLAACAQVLQPVTSIYWWQGSIHRENERLIFLKTTGDLLPAIRELLSEIHPYEVPELVFLPIQWGSSDYLSWLAENIEPQRR
jgi:periplasmic divalent cation tolerance protein